MFDICGGKWDDFSRFLMEFIIKFSPLDSFLIIYLLDIISLLIGRDISFNSAKREFVGEDIKAPLPILRALCCNSV